MVSFLRFTPTPLSARTARAMGVFVGVVGIAPSCALVGCVPLRFGGEHQLDVVLTLAAGETAEVRHFTVFGQASEPNISTAGELVVDATVCRSDGQALGARLGAIRLVADVPSTQIAEASLEGDSPCIGVDIFMSDDCASVTAPVSGTECGVTVEIARDAGAAPIELEVSASISGWVGGAGEEPNGFVSGIREDA